MHVCELFETDEWKVDALSDEQQIKFSLKKLARLLHEFRLKIEQFGDEIALQDLNLDYDVGFIIRFSENLPSYYSDVSEFGEVLHIITYFNNIINRINTDTYNPKLKRTIIKVINKYKIRALPIIEKLSVLTKKAMRSNRETF